MSYPKPDDDPCRERQGILDSIKATVDHIIVLHNLEIDAISKGHMEEWETIRHNIRKAAEYKDSLVELYELHLLGMSAHNRCVRAGATV